MQAHVMANVSSLQFSIVAAVALSTPLVSQLSSIWAARCNTWLLIELTPKGVVFSFLYFKTAVCMQEKQRRGQNLTTWLRSLAGIRNNNPKNAPGVPHISWTPAITAWQLAHCKGVLQCLSKCICAYSFGPRYNYFWTEHDT